MLHEKSQPKAGPPRAEKNLIISADDFGKSELANQKILELAKTGKLDRVSVMSGGNFTAEEIRKLAETGIEIDIHLELPWQKRRRGKLQDNTIKQGILLLANYFWKDGKSAVKRKWKKQIEEFQEIFGRNPDGINSHEYIHFFPAYFKIVLEFAEKFSISRVRFAKLGFSGKRNIAYLTLNALRWWNKKYFSVSGLNSPDYLVSLDWIRDIEKFLRTLPEGKIEVACHPERKEEFEAIKKYF